MRINVIDNSNLGPLAQSVEQRTFNPWVVGSIPTGPTTCFKEQTKKVMVWLDYLYRPNVNFSQVQNPVNKYYGLALRIEIQHK